MALDNMNGGGIGGLHSKQVGRITIFFDGITKTEIFRVNLDTKQVSFQGFTVDESSPGIEHLQFDLTHPNDDPQEGRMHWNADDGTLDFGLPGGSVNLQIGQEMLVRVKNDSGSDIANGEVLRIDGAVNDRPKVAPATNAAFPGADAIFFATESILNGQFGFATAFGLVRDVDTDHVTVGATAWLGIDGAFTETRPTAPSFSVVVGHVVKKHATEGVMFAHFAHSPRLAGLSDVYLVGTPTNGQYLAWSTANSRWEIAGP